MRRTGRKGQAVKTGQLERGTGARAEEKGEERQGVDLRSRDNG